MLTDRRDWTFRQRAMGEPMIWRDMPWRYRDGHSRGHAALEGAERLHLLAADKMGGFSASVGIRRRLRRRLAVMALDDAGVLAELDVAQRVDTQTFTVTSVVDA